MIIATHRYSEKTSHHGFRTRYLAFCSVAKFLNSPTGIILAAAPHWWKRGRTETKIGFSTLGRLRRTSWHRFLKLYGTQRERKCPAMLGFPGCSGFGYLRSSMTVQRSLLCGWIQSGETSLTTCDINRKSPPLQSVYDTPVWSQSDQIGASPYAKWPFALFDGNICNHHKTGYSRVMSNLKSD